VQNHKRQFDAARLRRIARKAVAEGYGKLLKLGHVHLYMAMDCEAPYRFTLWSRGGLDIYTGTRIRPITVTGESRCRKCDPCRKRRSMHWAARAIDEYKRWPVTVFGTLTASPEQHALLDIRARQLVARKGNDFDLITDQERFIARARVFGAEVTKWLKRVRIGRDGRSIIPIRYLLVAEVHDSEKTSAGMRFRPHFHIMLHDVAGAAVKGSPLEAFASGEDGEWVRVRDRSSGRFHVYVADQAFMREQWTLGFSKFQFAEDQKAAFYVCKYISKSLATRVRASQGYGWAPTHSVGQNKRNPLFLVRENGLPPLTTELCSTS